MWTLHDDFRNAASKAWSIPVTGSAAKQTLRKISHCHDVFQKWNAEVFGNIYENIRALKVQLEHIQGLPSSLYSQVMESEIQNLLDIELQKEEEMWRLKSRVDWLKGGDKNTSFFHAATLKRRHRNRILKLKSPTGEWSTTDAEVSNILCNHFQSLFSSDPINNNALNLVLDAVQLVVAAPENADQFQPISLCNIAFKIITKLITDQLNGALDKIISPTQSAFVPNRFISDNILVAHGMLHYIKKQKKGKEKFLALKLDMRKAYDKLEWNFIEGQAINLQKSSLTFSPNTHDRIKRWFSRILKVKHGDGPSKYLGLPTHFDVSKKEVFNDIKEKTLGKLQGWKEKLLSHAGKEVLLKAVVAPMANYAGSHFKLPAYFHDSMKKASSSFYWGDSKDKQKVHWMSWQRLCRSKSRGGLGFKDTKLQNKALLAKAA
ncbi:uncharacterized protein LOC122644785 [Telopea speciosissima]|uniref:uncharacterized protein LOC122644785 n=1 Tax=Telopea speciosissima TaxID=54955 RepID=UPI001CC6BE32|nr:uncharacterized protein LOC122644785 [Telopea speciosissima]